MRILAWVLAIAAMACSIFVAVSWTRARSGAIVARSSLSKFQSQANNWQEVANMEHEHLRAVVENDELELRGDDLTIDIARMTGKGLRSAFASREQHNTVLMFDQLAQSNDESIEAIGLPDPRVSSATERGQAAANSLGIYLAIANRDEHLAWGAAVLWLAFGFAVALSARPK